MAIYAQITDKGAAEPRKLRWGWWHLTRIFEVLEAENVAETAVLHIVESDYRFVDPSDGEVLEFHPGDRIETWRNR
jgi:hypothetical protein